MLTHLSMFFFEGASPAGAPNGFSGSVAHLGFYAFFDGFSASGGGGTPAASWLFFKGRGGRRRGR